jgi:hypothetical protein
LAIEDPRIVNHVVVVDIAQVRVFLLLKLLGPVIILHGEVNLVVKVLVLEGTVRYFVLLLSLGVCLVKAVKN